MIRVSSRGEEAQRRSWVDPGPSNGEPQAKRQAKGEDEKVFYPNYGIPEGDLPSDAAILESNDGFYFYCLLEGLAENSSFFKDLLSLELVADTTTDKTKSPVGTSLPVIPLPRVSSVALAFIISTFTPAKPDYVDKAAVVKDIRAIITAAEYLNLDCWRLRNIACSCWDWDQKPYPHEEFAITCALSPHPPLLAEIAGRTHREPLRGEKLVKVQAMMADQSLYSDFLEGLKVAHECHCGDQERIEIALENINSMGIERTFRKKCWPKGYQPDGCESFERYDGNFDRLIYNAAMTVLAHLSDRGLRPEGYPDHYIASELLMDDVPCKTCRDFLSETLSYEIVSANEDDARIRGESYTHICDMELPFNWQPYIHDRPSRPALKQPVKPEVQSSANKNECE